MHYSGLTTRAVTSVIDRLKRQNLARRDRDPDDRRRVIVSANLEQVACRVEPFYRGLVERLGEVYSGFDDDEELQVIQRYAGAVNRIMHDETLRLREIESCA